ncbi:MAG: hypothetical protein ABWZ82_07375 [Candidatus Limnocylindrales bacterium]
MDGWAAAVGIGVILARFLVPLLIPLWPLPTMIAALVLDAVDQTVFQSLAPDADLSWYQGYDKALDVYYLGIAYLSTLRNWTNHAAFQVSRFLYYYRLVGATLFEATGLRWLLLVFPNTFEYFFDTIEAIRTRWDPRRVGATLVVGIAACIWIFIKLPQEWWIHIAQLDTTDIIQERIFGVPPGTSWADTLAGQWWIVIGFVVVVVLLIVLAWWVITRKLPPPDRPFTLHADAQQPPLDPEAVRAAEVAIAGRLWAVATVEKVVFLVLITAIFGMMLDLRIAPVALAVAVGVVVVLTTAISHWLTRRGSTPEGAVRQFLVTILVVGAVVLGLALITPLPGGDGALLMTLFFVVLMSVLITMFDRFLPRHIARFAKG